MDIRQYLDATYLKTPAQAGITEAQNREVVQSFVKQAISQNFKLVMLRPDMVAMARDMVDAAQGKVLVGTVIDFPEGKGGAEQKRAEAVKAIADGADELDFVVNYTSFIGGGTAVVADEIKQCTALGFEHGKAVKWIIEIAALTDTEVAAITAFIRDVITSEFQPRNYKDVFIKSSTGFYQTEGNRPNGATLKGIKIMLANAGPLPVKASGGIKNYREAVEMVNLGVKRIGTSSAAEIVNGAEATGGY